MRSTSNFSLVPASKRSRWSRSGRSGLRVPSKRPGKVGEKSNMSSPTLSSTHPTSSFGNGVTLTWRRNRVARLQRERGRTVAFITISGRFAALSGWEGGRTCEERSTTAELRGVRRDLLAEPTDDREANPAMAPRPRTGPLPGRARRRRLGHVSDRGSSNVTPPLFSHKVNRKATRRRRVVCT